MCGSTDPPPPPHTHQSPASHSSLTLSSMPASKQRGKHQPFPLVAQRPTLPTHSYSLAGPACQLSWLLSFRLALTHPNPQPSHQTNPSHPTRPAPKPHTLYPT